MNNSKIFSYDNLIEKAKRELDRLRKAENDELNSEDALDHALNAAFTIYHLLLWKEKHFNPGSTETEHKLCQEMNDENFNMLHSVVTYNKHASVERSFLWSHILEKLMPEKSMRDNILYVYEKNNAIFCATKESEILVRLNNEESEKKIKNKLKKSQDLSKDEENSIRQYAVENNLMTKSNFEPNAQEKVENIAAQNGNILVTESGDKIVTQNSRVIVYFGELEAINVLTGAINRFL